MFMTRKQRKAKGIPLIPNDEIKARQVCSVCTKSKLIENFRVKGLRRSSVCKSCESSEVIA